MNMICLECGSEMVRDTRPDRITYKGHSVEVQQPGWYCQGCNEVIFEGPDSSATEPAFMQLKADVDGILTPAEVKRIRLKLGLTQRKAGPLLRGGPRSFQKYESGSDWITRAMANLLRLLDRDPSRLSELIDTRGRVAEDA